MQLAQVKKLVFEHDLTLSDFFRMCINQEAYRTFNRENDAASLSSKAKRDASPFQFSIPIQQLGFASQPSGGSRSPHRFQQNYVTKDQMFRALDELGSKMPINDFNTMVCAFRVIKNSIIQRADFMSVFNRASLALVSGSPK